MKVLMVSDARSVHTRRWSLSLVERGIDLVLFSINPAGDDFYERHGIRCRTFDMFAYKRNGGGAFAAMCSHMRAGLELRRMLKEEKPDILHAHYATSYGFLASLSGFHPFVLSVWGSDIYEFPRKSVLNRLSVKFMLRRADRVLSTSRVMAEEASGYFKGDIGITPFGVDTALFRRKSEYSRSTGERRFVFGTVKTLSPKYGIDLLIKAYSMMRRHMPELYSLLVIAGDGPSCGELKKLAEECGFADEIRFMGHVDNGRLPEVYSSFDVAVFLSREESFGVAAVEAMSCGCPVIVSAAPGLVEVTGNGEAGVVVPCEDAEAAADAMCRLVSDPPMRKKLSEAGRSRVESLYDWDSDVSLMIGEYVKQCSKRI